MQVCGYSVGNEFLLWQLLFIDETRVWSEVQGDMGDLGEMRHDHLGEWKNELTRGMCWGCQCFLLVRIQFPAMSILFLAVPNYLFWNNSIILAFVGLACGHFLFMAISSNVIKEVLTVLCFTHFVKCLGRKISWSASTPHLYLKV